MDFWVRKVRQRVNTFVIYKLVFNQFAHIFHAWMRFILVFRFYQKLSPGSRPLSLSLRSLLNCELCICSRIWCQGFAIKAAKLVSPVDNVIMTESSFMCVRKLETCHHFCNAVKCQKMQPNWPPRAAAAATFLMSTQSQASMGVEDGGAYSLLIPATQPQEREQPHIKLSN